MTISFVLYREFKISDTFLQSGENFYSPDIIVWRHDELPVVMPPGRSSYSYHYRVDHSIPLEEPIRGFRRFGLVDGDLYAPALVALMPENDGMFDFLNWGRIPGLEMPLYAMFLSPTMKPRGFQALVAENRLKFAFVPNVNDSVGAFSRWMAISEGDICPDVVEKIFTTPTPPGQGRPPYAKRSLSPVERAANVQWLYQLFREEEPIVMMHNCHHDMHPY